MFVTLVSFATSVFGFFFLLLAGHALADFALQSPWMAQAKNRNRKVDPATIPPGQTPQTIWPYVLTAHALIHGLTVALILGHVVGIYCGIGETVAHWVIDFGKCENKYGIHMDQALHVFCKVAWLVVFVVVT